MRRPTKLVILSAQAVLRETLRISLAQTEGFEIHSCDCVEACRQLEMEFEDSLLLADVRHPVPDLLGFLAPPARRRPFRVLLLGVDPSPDAEGLCFLEMDVEGLLPLNASLEKMIEAIEGILRGERVYPPSIVYLLYQRLAQKSQEQDLRQRLAALALTPRELEILQLVASRCSNGDIASRLGISIHTVKNHVHNILDKLQVESRDIAAELACRKGWLEPTVPMADQWLGEYHG